MIHAAQELADYTTTPDANRLHVADFDPAYDALVAEVARLSQHLRYMPASVLTFAMMDACYARSIAKARDGLLLWCDNETIPVQNRKQPPTLWVLHYDGFRYLGMPDDEASFDVPSIAPDDAVAALCAIVSPHVIVDFSRPSTWERFTSFPDMYPYNFDTLIRSVGQ